jgi:hypothetical protein
MQPPYNYQAFGLTIVSDLPCPELLPGTGPAQVSIRYGPVPDNLASNQEDLNSVREQKNYFQVNAGEFLLKLEDVGKYLVLRGEEIIIERAPGVPDNEVRLFLLGSAMAALLHQRGLLPLHACAVEVNGGAAIFVGPSGIGKSTLAGVFHQRDYPIMADDVCVISFSAAGEPLVSPAYPQLKLWSDALNLLGKESAGLPVITAGMEKYGLPLKAGFSQQPRPLKWVYELTIGISPALELTPLTGVEKITVLMHHTYRSQLLARDLERRRHFQQCGRAARQCQVSRLARPETCPPADLADLIEADWE